MLVIASGLVSRTRPEPGMIDILKTHGARIKQARTDAGLSRLELAERIGTTEATLKAWENSGGFGYPPGAHSMLKIAEATGKPASFFWVTDDELEERRMFVRLVAVHAD